jgi:hypothetical protein
MNCEIKRMPDLEAIENLVSEAVKAAPIEIVMAIFDGDEDGTYDNYSPEFLEQLRKSTGSYLCWLWLQAAKKRASEG